jgi:tetratricopeptide (TPR) repeat protein
MITRWFLSKMGRTGLIVACLCGADGAAERETHDPTLASRTVTFWQSRAERDPKGFLEWRELSAAYLARQRETGDITDAVNAEKAARRSLEIQQRRNASAWMRLSRSLLTQHRFPEALQAAEKAISLDTSANRLVADIRIELGDIDDAERALAADGPKDDDLNYLALSARLDQARGRHEAAVRKLREACEIVDARPDMPAETAAWTYTMLGHTLIDAGQLEAGEKACHQALAVLPDDYRALTGLAEAAAWRQDWKSTERWARRAVAISAQNPEALRLLHEALAKQGDSAGAKAQARRLEELCKSFPRIYDRHWALFCADNGQDLDQALTIARNDLELRKDPGAYDTLAWVAFKKGLIAEAGRHIDRAIASGTQSAAIFSHGGAIASAAGDKDRAAAFFDRSRALNPYLLKSAQAD